MVQLQRMDAHLDTLSTELYQVNIRVDRIARWQASMGGFASEASLPPPPPMASNSEDEDEDDGDGDDDDASDDADGNASSTDKMSTWHSYPLLLVTKKGSNFGYESSHF